MIIIIGDWTFDLCLVINYNKRLSGINRDVKENLKIIFNLPVAPQSGCAKLLYQPSYRCFSN